VKVLYAHAHGPGVIHTSKKALGPLRISGVEDRCTGLSAKIVRALGGAPVAMPVGDTYDALSRVSSIPPWRRSRTRRLALSRGRWYSLKAPPSGMWCISGGHEQEEVDAPPDIKSPSRRSATAERRMQTTGIWVKNQKGVRRRWASGQRLFKGG
jgi:hypothetical protein